MVPTPTLQYRGTKKLQCNDTLHMNARKIDDDIYWLKKLPFLKSKQGQIFSSVT